MRLNTDLLFLFIDWRVWNCRAGGDLVHDASLRRVAPLQQGDGAGRPTPQAHHPSHLRRADAVAACRRHVSHLCTARLHQPPLSVYRFCVLFGLVHANSNTIFTLRNQPHLWDHKYVTGPS